MIEEKTKRSLFYYDLYFKPYKKFEGVEHAYLHCLDLVNKWVDSKDSSRYLIRESDTIFFGDLRKVDGKDYLLGKLYKVRKDVFPQLIDMSNEDIKDLEVDSVEQGVLEITHFFIDCRNKAKATLALEYNHSGARITDFQKYFSHLGSLTKIIRKVAITPIARDRLESLVTRLNKMSSFIMRVRRDNIERVQGENQELGDAFHHAQNYSDSDYIELKGKFNYRERQETNKAKTGILELVKKIITVPETSSIFDVFIVEGEDEEKDNKLEVFNVLVDKEMSRFLVDKKPKSKVLVSNDFFPKIIKEYERKFL